jgi:hypothetical protein
METEELAPLKKSLKQLTIGMKDSGIKKELPSNKVEAIKSKRGRKKAKVASDSASSDEIGTGSATESPSSKKKSSPANINIDDDTVMEDIGKYIIECLNNIVY